MRILPGFLVFNLVSIASDALAICLNIGTNPEREIPDKYYFPGLIVALQVYASQLDMKTGQFAIAYSVLSIIFSIGHLFMLPFTVIFHGMGITFSASFLHDENAAEYITHFVMSPCYVALLECGAFNFLYKYAATCNKWLYVGFFRLRFIGGLTAVAATWLLLFTYFAQSFKPTAAFREKVAAALNERFHTDFRNPSVYFGGIEADEEHATDVARLIALLNFMSLIFCSLGTMIWCGWRIHHSIGSNKLSERARKCRRQALRLIVLQTFNPLFFVLFPVLMPLAFVQLRVTLPEWFSWFNAYALLLFPILNPIIFVICIREFRRVLLARLNCYAHQTSTSQSMSLSRKSIA